MADTPAEHEGKARHGGLSLPSPSSPAAVRALSVERRLAAHGELSFDKA